MISSKLALKVVCFFKNPKELITGHIKNMEIVIAVVWLYKIHLSQIKLIPWFHICAGFTPAESSCKNRLQVFLPPHSKQMAALAFRRRLMGVQHGISVLQYIALLAELQELFSELCRSLARIAKRNGRYLLVLGSLRTE